MKKARIILGIIVTIIGLCMVIISLMDIEIPKYIPLIAGSIDFIAAFLMIIIMYKEN
jgi:hypothetical protein